MTQTELVELREAVRTQVRVLAPQAQVAIIYDSQVDGPGVGWTQICAVTVEPRGRLEFAALVEIHTAVLRVAASRLKADVRLSIIVLPDEGCFGR